MSTPPSRPSVVCPDSGPEPPYPLRMEGEVISGFGRGSKEVCLSSLNFCLGCSLTCTLIRTRTRAPLSAVLS